MPFKTVSRIIELLFSWRVDILLIPFLTLDHFGLQPPTLVQTKLIRFPHVIIRVVCIKYKELRFMMLGNT